MLLILTHFDSFVVITFNQCKNQVFVWLEFICLLSQSVRGTNYYIPSFHIHQLYSLALGFPMPKLHQ